MHTYKHVFAAMACAGLLAACGGGGSDVPPAPTTSATVSLSGTAAKGLMAFADVGVYAVNADGSVAASALATTTTDKDGRYSLTFEGQQGQPYVVKVSAKADGSTTHLDEVSGLSQALPAGFAMRSLVVPATTGSITTTASVTPFSEMAVAASARASGGLTATNAAQAMSSVQQMLGFDPIAVTATTAATATSADEKKLALMLTAVSQLASSGSLGCSSGSAGDKVKCVAEALAGSASKDSIRLGDATHDVSARLSEALTQVMADSRFSDKVDPSLMTTVLANLGCGSNCAAAPVGTSPGSPGATVMAIAHAKVLFAQIKSDWSAMFSRGGASSIAGGAANLEALALRSAMTDIQVPVDLLAKDLGALLMGVDLYNDYQAGRDQHPVRGRAYGELVSHDSGDFSSTPAVGCTLFTDASATVQATTPAEAKVIGCSARYYLRRSVSSTAGGNSMFTEWRHGFTITPNADGSFSYDSRARRREQTCSASGCTLTANVALQTDASGNILAPFSGSITPVLDSAFGAIKSFILTGELPGAFKIGGTALENFKHAVNLSGTQTVATDDTVSSALSGSIVAYPTAGNPIGTLTVKSGTMKQVPVAAGVHEPSEFMLDLAWTTGGAEFEGQFSATDSVQDKSKSIRVPTKATLSGALRNMAGGMTTEFLRGTLTASLTGVPAFDYAMQPAADNSYGIELAFVGAVTASGRPTLELSLGSAWIMDSANGHGTDLTLQYRSIVGGSPRLVVSLVGSRSSANASIDTFRLTEAAGNLSMAWTGSSPGAVDLYYADTTKIGSLGTDSGLMTFSDGSFISLDLGL